MKKFKFSVLFMVLFVFLMSGCEEKTDKFLTREEPSGLYDLADKQNESMPEGMPESKTDVKYNKKVSGSSEDLKENVQADKNMIEGVQKRMIIQTGTMSLEVDVFDETALKISDAVKKYEGYIFNTTSSRTSSGLKQGTITVKVPADKFDAVVSEISSFGKVMSQKIQANDVTEEYIDLESRVKTQKELEQRLIKLLAERTAKLTDVVEVEEKLASVRQKIESIEGRMRYLRSQSDMSTLTVSVFEPTLLDTSSGGGFFYELGQAVKKGLSGFTKVFAGILTISIAMLPLIILLLIIIFIVIKVIRRKKKPAKA